MDNVKILIDSIVMQIRNIRNSSCMIDEYISSFKELQEYKCFFESKQKFQFNSNKYEEMIKKEQFSIYEYCKNDSQQLSNPTTKIDKSNLELQKDDREFLSEIDNRIAKGITNSFDKSKKPIKQFLESIDNLEFDPKTIPYVNYLNNSSKKCQVFQLRLKDKRHQSTVPHATTGFKAINMQILKDILPKYIDLLDIDQKFLDNLLIKFDIY